MAVLHNRVNKLVLRDKLMQEPFKRVTISFYRYVRLEDCNLFRDMLFKQWSALGCFGRIYVAYEGINAQMSVPEHNFEQFLDQLNTMPQLAQMPIKQAVEDDGKSFYKLIIKIRTKIVADGLDDNAFDFTNVGTHLTPQEFNAALDLPETIVVDMRNGYETEIGRFENAILPQTETFREELPLVADMLAEQKDKKILLYCTGGIRCEKASAYLKSKGFEDVNQLHGGIIEYAKHVKNNGLKSKFKGKNFVFDDRLGERITDDVLSNCHQCGKPCDTHKNCAYNACHILFIQCHDCATAYNQCCSMQCKELHALPQEEQKALYGKIEVPGKGRHYFKKSQSEV